MIHQFETESQIDQTAFQKDEKERMSDPHCESCKGSDPRCESCKGSDTLFHPKNPEAHNPTKEASTRLTSETKENTEKKSSAQIRRERLPKAILKRMDEISARSKRLDDAITQKSDEEYAVYLQMCYSYEGC